MLSRNSSNPDLFAFLGPYLKNSSNTDLFAFLGPNLKNSSNPEFFTLLAIGQFLKNFSNPHLFALLGPFLKNSLKALTQWSFENSLMTLNGEYFQQIFGVIMGTNFAPIFDI